MHGSPLMLKSPLLSSFVIVGQGTSVNVQAQSGPAGGQIYVKGTALKFTFDSLIPALVWMYVL